MDCPYRNRSLYSATLSYVCRYLGTFISEFFNPYLTFNITENLCLKAIVSKIYQIYRLYVARKCHRRSVSFRIYFRQKKVMWIKKYLFNCVNIFFILTFSKNFFSWVLQISKMIMCIAIRFFRYDRVFHTKADFPL